MRKPAIRSRRPADIAKRDPLGRVFSVCRETWRLKDDPRITRPVTELLASRRTAAEAADLAREAAAAAEFIRRGFHKPSGSWWAADASSFHRFRIVRADRGRGLAFALVSAATGVALFSLLRPKRSGQEQAEG